jgi:hypothetical protein
VQFSQSEAVEYNGVSLLDNQTYYFRIITKDPDGAWSPWSESTEFSMNSLPVINELKPIDGTADEFIDLSWQGFDSDGDDLNYTLQVKYDFNWRYEINMTPVTNYRFNTENFHTLEDIDFRIMVFDGYESSKVYYNPKGNITIIHNNPPSVKISAPDANGGIANEYYRILYKSFDIDDEDSHTIDLYYSETKNFEDKNTIELALPDTGQYVWNTANINQGHYYICIVISDGKSMNHTFSDGLLTIDHTVDTNPPRVVSTVPDPDSHDIPLSQQISVKFNKPMNIKTVTSPDFFIVKDSTDRIVEGRRDYIESDFELIFKSDYTLEYGQKYTVILKAGIKDASGKFLDGNGDYIQQKSTEDDYIWSFSTVPRSVDTSPPTILFGTPEDQSQDVDVKFITAVFNEEIDRSTLTPAPVFMYDKIGTVVDIEIIFLSDQNKLRIDFYGDLKPGTKYTILITAVIRDLAGHGLDGNGDGKSQSSPVDDYSWSFTTKESVIHENGVSSDEQWDSTVIISISLILLILIIIIIGLIVKKKIKREKFIIHDIFVVYDDGRLLAHQSFESISNVEESAMGGMLTAIQNFVLESFRHQETEKLEEIRYGKLKIVLAHGKNVYLAAVCTGDFRINNFKKDMHNLLALIEYKFEKVLDNWDGSMKKVKGIRELIRF